MGCLYQILIIDEIADPNGKSTVDTHTQARFYIDIIFLTVFQRNRIIGAGFE